MRHLDLVDQACDRVSAAITLLIEASKATTHDAYRGSMRKAAAELDDIRSDLTRMLERAAGTRK